MIRRYREGDIPTCISHIQNYLEGNTYTEGNDHYKGLDFSTSKMYKVLIDNLADVRFFCNLIIADENVVGGLCAYVAEPIFSNRTFAYDQFLYVVPEFKNYKAVFRLIKSYTDWAKRRDVAQCYLRTSTLYRSDSFAKLCKRLGFEKYEIGFAKGIN